MAVVGVCVVCMLGSVCGVLVVRSGACPRLSGRGLAPLFGVGAVCRGPSPVSAVWFPAPPGWGLLVVCPPAAPFACPPPSVSFPYRLGRCFSGAVPGPSRLWWVRGGPCRRLGSLPLVFPRGGADACTPRQGVTLLYGPSICTRSVPMDLLRSQVLQPFPTPGSAILWVAGESLRDRRVSCLPRWTVCPTRSPSLGPNRSTCRGECSWSGPFVTPPGRCHRGPLTNGPGRIPPYCVCSGGADTVTGGAPKPVSLGPSPASPVSPVRPAPLLAVWFAVVGFPSLRGGVVVVVGGDFFAVPGRVACVRVASSSGCGSPSVCVFVARCVRAWCLCWCVVRGSWCVVCGGGVLGGLWLVCGVVGPSPLLAEVPVCYSPPLLAGFRCRWWCAVPRHSWLGFRCRQWCVVCGVWCVVCGVQRWCVGAVVAGVWCGWSLATPGGGSYVLLLATPGWVSLPVVVGGPRHSWLRSPGGGGVWWGCGWCVVWLVPRHSWQRFLCATPRHSWLRFAAGGGGRSSPLLAEGPGRGSPPLLAGVRWRRWCVVGLWLVCGVVGPSPLLAEVPVCYSPPLLAWFRCRWWCAVPATPGWGLLAAVVRGVWCVVCGVWCVTVVCWWGCGWFVMWLVPRHSWRSFLCATPRHSWLGFAAGGGGGSSPLLAEGPGRGSPPLLAGVRWRLWCAVGLWLVCGVVRPSPLLAEVPACYSPPLLAGFRCRWWCVVPRHFWLGSAGGGGVRRVVCGV